MHPDFYAFLASINIHLNYNLYVDHSQFKENLKNRALDTIDTEDKALMLLLGLKIDYFQKFWAFLQTRKNGSTWDNQNDQFFEREYSSFMEEEYPTLGFPYGRIKLFCDRAKEHSLWNGDFKAYIEALHDEGFLFKPEIYEELKAHGIEPVYTPDGWARTFYKQWINNQGVWRLKDAACLYLGDDPNEGRNFICMYGPENKTVIKKGPGMILSDSEIVFPLDNNGDLDLMQNCRFKDVSRLETFIKKHIAGGNLQPASADGLGEGLYFKPKEIIEFFQSRFLNVPPKALLIELGLDTPGIPLNTETKPNYLRVQECYKQHGSVIIAELTKEKGRMPKKKEIASRMIEEHLPDINEGTVLKNFKPSNDLRQRRTG